MVTVPPHPNKTKSGQFATFNFVKHVLDGFFEFSGVDSAGQKGKAPWEQ